MTVLMRVLALALLVLVTSIRYEEHLVNKSNDAFEDEEDQDWDPEELDKMVDDVLEEMANRKKAPPVNDDENLHFGGGLTAEELDKLVDETLAEQDEDEEPSCWLWKLGIATCLNFEHNNPGHDNQDANSIDSNTATLSLPQTTSIRTLARTMAYDSATSLLIT
ncbi:unnamed protein product [Symbiodinium pilosum]|uniref:Uncharacterized protein n=1 Tax=Symbiodinium pilosum TaxID=2952 RepID=A0A812VZN8_SYMPI|nr:unnamed protein product [Symbiodinium pilosum]